MRKAIAVAVSLGVVAFFFGQALFPAFAKKSVTLDKSSALVNLPTDFKFPKLLLGGDTVADEAWLVFEQYREFARENDLDGVKSLSHQISDTCLSPALLDECNTLMQSVYLLTTDWEKSDFVNVVYDNRQIILSTNFVQALVDNLSIKAIIFFTRTTKGEPKVLGIKFCYDSGVSHTEECVNTDPSTRDLDNNGWWDDVEARFY